MAGDEPATTHVLPAHIQVLLAPQTSGRAGGKNSIGVRIAKCDTNELDSVSCPSAALCVAVDNAGNVVTSARPAGGIPAWQVTNVDRGHFFEGVSCRSVALCVAGDSAGGGLGAALLLAIRDRGLPLPACAVLISGWYDLTTSLQSLDRNVPFDPLVMRDVLEAMASAYVPSGQDRRNPLISPLFSDPTGLPPLLIQVSTHEVLADESAVFAQNAQKAGVATTLEMVDEMVHVWHQYAHLVPEAKDAIASAGAFIRKHFGQAHR